MIENSPIQTQTWFPPMTRGWAVVSAIVVGLLALLAAAFLHMELHASAVWRLDKDIKAAGGGTAGPSDFGIFIVGMGRRVSPKARFELLKRLYQLKSPGKVLEISAKDVTTEEWELIGKMVWLRRLDLSGSNFDDQAATHLTQLKELEALWINDTQVTGKGLSVLNDLRKIDSLRIERCPIDERALKVWSERHPKCFRYEVLLRMLTAPKQDGAGTGPRPPSGEKGRF